MEEEDDEDNEDQEDDSQPRKRTRTKSMVLDDEEAEIATRLSLARPESRQAASQLELDKTRSQDVGSAGTDEEDEDDVRGVEHGEQAGDDNRGDGNTGFEDNGVCPLFFFSHGFYVPYICFRLPSPTLMLLHSLKDLVPDLLRLGCPAIPNFPTAQKLERVIFLPKHVDLLLHQKPMSGPPLSITHKDLFFLSVEHLVWILLGAPSRKLLRTVGTLS
jgi:hypothetical protein